MESKNETQLKPKKKKKSSEVGFFKEQRYKAGWERLLFLLLQSQKVPRQRTLDTALPASTPQLEGNSIQGKAQDLRVGDGRNPSWGRPIRP